MTLWLAVSFAWRALPLVIHVSPFCLFQVLAQMSLTFPVGASLATLMESETLFPTHLDCVILFHSVYHYHTRHWRIVLKVMCHPSLTYKLPGVFVCFAVSQGLE